MFSKGKDFISFYCFGLSLLFTIHWQLHAGLVEIPGFTIASHPESPIVYLRLKKSMGSLNNDIHLLESISERVRNVATMFFLLSVFVVLSVLLYLQVLKEDSVFVVTSRRSTLDKCRLPVGIRLFVSAGHSESDLHKASESLKRVAALVL